jgi:hypothetical protein
MGTSLKLVTKYLNLKFDYLFWILKTFTIGVAGADGTEYSSILRPTFEINFTRRIHLSLQYLYYLNWGKYPDYPDTKRNISKLRAYISYDF